MRLLQTGDLHLRTRDLDDQVPVLNWIAQQVREHSVDIVVIAGDLAGRACPHLSRPAERIALLDFVTACTRHCSWVVVLRGNHDVPEDWAWLNAVPKVRYITRPELFNSILWLPYPDRSWLAAGEVEDVTVAMSQAIEATTLGLLAQGRTDVVIGHMATTGAKASTGQPLIGTDVEVSVPALARAGVKLALLNHVHLPQEFTRDECRVVHVGSPWPTDFGEAEDKRVLLVDDVRNRPMLTSLPTPHVRLMTADLEWNAPLSRWDGDLPAVDDRTRVRLRLTYPEGARIDLEPVRVLEDAGARGVVVQRCPVVERRTRDPEVVAARDPVDRYVAFERSHRREPDAREMALAGDLVAGRDVVVQ